MTHAGVSWWGFVLDTSCIRHICARGRSSTRCVYSPQTCMTARTRRILTLETNRSLHEVPLQEPCLIKVCYTARCSGECWSVDKKGYLGSDTVNHSLTMTMGSQIQTRSNHWQPLTALAPLRLLTDVKWRWCNSDRRQRGHFHDCTDSLSPALRLSLSHDPSDSSAR